MVERYFKALVAKDYHSAYLLWADKGAAVRGTERAFAETFADYAKYDPKTGDPSEIHVRDGVQYVLVSASVDVVHRHNGESWHREGTVALKRSADRAVKDPDMRDWRIWSVDIRVKH